jgi:hypothetical protein
VPSNDIDKWITEESDWVQQSRRQLVGLEEDIAGQ